MERHCPEFTAVHGPAVHAAVRLVAGKEVLTVAADPMVDNAFMANDIGVSENVVRGLLKELNLQPVMVRPRVPRYFLSEWEGVKRALPRQTAPVEPPQLLRGKVDALKGGLKVGA